MNRIKAIWALPARGVREACTSVTVLVLGAYTYLYLSAPGRFTTVLPNGQHPALYSYRDGEASPSIADWILDGDHMKIAYAIGLSLFVCVSSFLILIPCLWIYLGSENPERAQRAGGIAKTALGFFLSAGVGALTFLGFTSK